MPEQIGICLSPGCLDRYIIKVSNSFVNVVSKTIKIKDKGESEVMRERGRKNRTSANNAGRMEKAVVLMLALIMCISSIVVHSRRKYRQSRQHTLITLERISQRIRSCLQHRMMPNGIKRRNIVAIFLHTDIITA